IRHFHVTGVQTCALPISVARRAIDDNSAIVVCDSVDEACAISNDFAPEHLSIADDSMIDRVTHAGSIFVGEWSPEAAGDYASGQIGRASCRDRAAISAAG